MLESFFNKVAGPQTSKFIKEHLQHRCFPVRFVKFSRASNLKNISERLLLTFECLKKYYAGVETLPLLMIFIMKGWNFLIVKIVVWPNGYSFCLMNIFYPRWLSFSALRTERSVSACLKSQFFLFPFLMQNVYRYHWKA